LLLDVVARGRWDRWRAWGQGQCRRQVGPPLLSDALLESIFTMKLLILIPHENTDKVFMSSSGQRRGFITGKQPDCPKAMLRLS